MATIKIKKSVGKSGKNVPEDTKKIQIALNIFAAQAKFSKLATDSDCGPKTIAAITAFQKNVMAVKADGRVDPGRATIEALNQKPGAKPKEDTGGGGGGGGGQKKPRKLTKKSGVVTSGVNKRLLYLVQEVSTHFEKDVLLTDGFRTPERMATTLWNNWVSLDRGKIYGVFKRDETLRKKFDGYFNNKDRATFIKEATTLAKNNKGMSWHMKGEAVDVRRSTLTSAMIKTLLLYLKSYNAGKSNSFVHFDTGGKSLKSAYSEVERAKWK